MHEGDPDVRARLPQVLQSVADGDDDVALPVTWSPEEVTVIARDGHGVASTAPDPARHA